MENNKAWQDAPADHLLSILNTALTTAWQHNDYEGSEVNVCLPLDSMAILASKRVKTDSGEKTVLEYLKSHTLIPTFFAERSDGKECMTIAFKDGKSRDYSI